MGKHIKVAARIADSAVCIASCDRLSLFAVNDVRGFEIKSIIKV